MLWEILWFWLLCWPLGEQLQCATAILSCEDSMQVPGPAELELLHCSVPGTSQINYPQDLGSVCN